MKRVVGFYLLKMSCGILISLGRFLESLMRRTFCSSCLFVATSRPTVACSGVVTVTSTFIESRGCALWILRRGRGPSGQMQAPQTRRHIAQTCVSDIATTRYQIVLVWYEDTGAGLQRTRVFDGVLVLIIQLNPRERINGDLGNLLISRAL